MRVIITLAVGLVVCAIVFGVLERLMPSDEHQPPLYKRRGVGLDLSYWIGLGLLDKVVFRLLIGLSLLGLFILLGWDPKEESVRAGFGPVLLQPKWLQFFEALLVADVVYYWLHRVFHTPRYWKIHAIHHSSTHVDWLSAKRGHPLNSAGNRLFPALTVLFLGFPPTVIGSWAISLVLWDMMIHANLNWTFGPLKYFVSSPVFHRWHHTTEREAQDKNFAGMFPFLDLLFGTFYMPKGKLPLEFGVNEPMPEDLIGQIVYPFKASPNADNAELSDENVPEPTAVLQPRTE